MTEKELADWLDGFARDMSDFGTDDGSGAKLKRAAAIIRARAISDEKQRPYAASDPLVN